MFLHSPLTRGVTGLCHVFSVVFIFQRCWVSYKGHEKEVYTGGLFMLIFHKETHLGLNEDPRYEAPKV